MASGVAYFSTNTDLGLVNALNQSLNLYLPLNAPNGKNIFIKDANGNSFRSTITVLTQGSDTFEDGSVQQLINTPYESMQLSYNATKWYITGGTMYNTMNVSSVRTNLITVNSISSSYLTVSSLSLVNKFASTNTFTTLSSLLYYNNNIVGGGLRVSIPQTLNQYASTLIFNPNSISNLSYWFDASVSSSMVVDSASTILTWYSISTVTTAPRNISNVITMTGPTTSNRGLYAPNSLNGFGGVNLSTSFLTTANITNQAQNYYYLNNTLNNNSEFTNICLINRLFAGNPVPAQSALHALQMGGNVRITVNADGSLEGLILTGAGGVQNLTGFNALCNTPSILLTSRNGPTSLVRLNGVSYSSNYSSALFGTANFQFMFGTNLYSQYYSGNLHEYIQYQRALSSNDIFRVEGYIAWKYNILTSLPSTHPFRYTPPY